MRQGVLIASLQQLHNPNSLTENLAFGPASGTTEARKFFKIQARTRPEKPETV